MLNKPIGIKTRNVCDLRQLEATKTSFAGVNGLRGGCIVIAEALNRVGLDVLAITFYDQCGERPSICPYRHQPEVLMELSGKLQDDGGCPVLRQALELGTSFSPTEISLSEQDS